MDGFGFPNLDHETQLLHPLIKIGHWKQLHKLVYFATVAVLVHFVWQIKAGVGAVPWYALIFIVLMLLRTKAR